MCRWHSFLCLFGIETLNFTFLYQIKAGPSGRAFQGVGLRPLAYCIVGSNLTGGMDVCRVCCVLSGRGLSDELITHPEESYRLWRVVVCDQETS
jgi:hypothetical protein